MDKHEFSTDGGKSWREVSEHTSIQFYTPGSVIFRVKPRTIKVNGFEITAPMSEAPAEGIEYFIACPSANCMHASPVWNNDEFDHRYLSRNICHTTKEAAIAHAKAMLGIDPNGGDE